jgi:hypothetical protein
MRWPLAGQHSPTVKVSQMSWILESWPFRSSARITIALAGIGICFFFGLIVYHLRRHNRGPVAGLLLIEVGCVSVLLRGLLGSSLSDHPSDAGGVWRLLNGAVLLTGGILFERGRRSGTGRGIEK